MRLCRHDDVALGGVGNTFRHGILVPLAMALFFIALTAGLAWFALNGGPAWLWICVGFLGLVFVPVSIGQVRSTLKSQNYIVRSVPEGVYIKFRSYLNSHFPGEDQTVVFIPSGEIAALRKVKERQIVPSGRSGGGDEVHLFKHLEIELRHNRVDRLATALHEERNREAAKIGISQTKHHDYPVRVVDSNLIRVNWGGVRPRLGKTLDILGRTYRVRKERDLGRRDWRGLEGAQLEDYVVELAEAGRLVGATKLVKRRYGYDLAQARRFVNELVGRVEA